MTMDGLMTMHLMHKFKTRNKRLLYSALSCGIWRSQHGRFDHHGWFDDHAPNAQVQNTQQTTFVQRLVLRNLALIAWTV